MRETKAVTVLKTLDPAEFKNFKRFIDSPYHNTSSDVKKLFMAIKSFYPKFKDERIANEALLKKLYPGQKGADVRLRKAYSDLNTVAEKYILQLEWEQNYPENEEYFVNALVYRKLDTMAAKNLEPLLEKYSKPSGISRAFMLKKYAFDNLNRTISKNIGGYRADKKICEKLAEDAAVFAVIAIIENFSNVMVSNSDMISDNTNAALDYLKCIDLTALAAALQKAGSPFYPVIEIYRDFYLLHAEENVEDRIDPLLDKIWKVYGMFEVMTWSNLHSIMEAILIRKKGLTKKEIRGLRLKLAKERVARGRYRPENGGMRQDSFMSILTTSLSCGDYHWTAGFLKQFRGVLKSPYREELGLFGEASLKVYLKDHESALETLSKITRKVERLKYHVRALTLISFFELGHTEEALSAIDAYKIALSREKNMTEVNMNNAANFVKYYEQIIKIRLGKAPVSFEKLKTEIASADEAYHISWLIEKAEDLEGRKKD